MPLVAHNDLPTFERLRQEGQRVLNQRQAKHQDIRELHIGLLNMMPDKALAATERQFLRLIGQSNPIAQFFAHPFTLPQLPRSEEARQYIERYYEPFEQIREQGLDGLIITGANVIGAELSNQPFWEPLIEVIDWASQHVTSTLCSCLATHAVLEFRYGQKRRPQPKKTWGVFSHKVVNNQHPLVDTINTRFDVPHSRWNDISREQFDSAGLRVLVESEQAGVHLATSADGLSFVFFQGHPEYDTVSLLKEYKRDSEIHRQNNSSSLPPFPSNYLGTREKALITEFNKAAPTQPSLPFPEALVTPALENTWHDTAEGVIGNWMGSIYQVTHNERNRRFMAHIDPDNPLQLPANEQS